MFFVTVNASINEIVEVSDENSFRKLRRQNKQHWNSRKENSAIISGRLHGCVDFFYDASEVNFATHDSTDVSQREVRLHERHPATSPKSKLHFEVHEESDGDNTNHTQNKLD